MPDLSDLLGDVYGGTAQGANPDGPPVVEEPAATDRPGPPVPEWAGDDRLDEAFGDWTPGPPPDAPRAEHDVMAQTAPPSRPAPLDDDLAAALSAALAAAPLHDEPARPAAPAPTAAAPSADPAPTASSVTTLAPLTPAAAALPALPEPPPAPPLGSFSRSAGSLFGQVAAPAVEPPAPAPDPVVADATPAGVAGLGARWQRSHDDILPRGARAGRGLRVR